MLNEQTYQKLIEMKLPAMAEGFRRYMDGVADDQLSFDERFGMLVDREYTFRQDRDMKKRLDKAELREKACLEDINYRHPRNLDRSVMQRLGTCQWIKNHQNVLITGATGLGKTWLACALANQACREGHSTRYARVSRLLQDLQIARADGRYTKALRQLAKTDVLILDDWGLARLNEEQRLDLLEIIEDRNQRRSTMVTSQIPVKNWHALIGDPTVADSILDRLVHSAHRIELTGRSMRKPSDEPEA